MRNFDKSFDYIDNILDSIDRNTQNLFFTISQKFVECLKKSVDFFFKLGFSFTAFPSPLRGLIEYVCFIYFLTAFVPFLHVFQL